MLQKLIQLKEPTKVKNDDGDTIELPEGSQVLYRQENNLHIIIHIDRTLTKWTATKPRDR